LFVKPLTADVDQIKLEKFLDVVVRQIASSPGPFIHGSRPTWADCFLYPLIADLHALPEGQEVLRVKSPALTWFRRMEDAEGVKDTYDGSLAAGGTP
jgi:glutathione S-transferase